MSLLHRKMNKHAHRNLILNKNLVPSKRFFKARLDSVEDEARKRDDMVRRHGNRNAKLLVRAERSDIPLIRKAIYAVVRVKKQRSYEPPTEEDLAEFDRLLKLLATTKIRKQIEAQIVLTNKQAAEEMWNAVQQVLKGGTEALPLMPDYLDRKVVQFTEQALEGYTTNYIKRISESFRHFVNAGDIPVSTLADAALFDVPIDDISKLTPEVIEEYVLTKQRVNAYIARTVARTVTGATSGLTQHAAYMSDPNVEWTRWITRGDDKVRDAHIINGATKNGIVKKGQPYADGSHICPSGYNCRCYAAPYTEDEVRVSNDGIPAPIGEDTSDVQRIVLEGEKRGFEVKRDGTVIDNRPRPTLYS